MPDPTLTPREVADELGVTVRTVQRWIADGRLEAERIGGRVRVSRSSLATVHAPTDAAARPIRSLLVANRGEIAVRVGRTARRLGIRTIGVHAPDERAPDGMDETHPVPSYLDGEALVAVATATGADALHPGYGFLAENPTFARAVTDAGLTWVGPPPEAIAAMGDKAAARQRVAAQGVPVAPGYDGDAQDDPTLAAAADRVGYPLLVKPSAGGGGKGMRVVRAAGELTDALAAARREAQRSFGDDRLILERYVEHARHVEIQVLFDAHGTGIHLGERDCSAQRRNQKVIEEAPGPAVSIELRERMGAAAVAAAASVDYVNAGTVEFLLADDGSFFFLEMNTRLQVEHPVTELITGRDLVAEQLRIAAGERIAARPPRLRGHAIEARLYAEDPEAGFLPATGRVVRLAWPDGVRVDTALRVGDTVGDRYDPMLAKLVVHASTRAQAVARLRDALEATELLGVTTNLRYLRWLVASEALRTGELRTDTLGALGVPDPPALTDAHWGAAAAALVPPGPDPWSGGWRLNDAPAVRLRSGTEERRVTVDRSRPAAVVADGTAFVDVEGRSVAFRLAPAPTVEEAVRHAAAGSGDHATLTAPMPGRVIALRAAEGASVEAGAPVVVIEAMKMEHAVVTPIAGAVTSLAVAEGQQVQRGDVLAEVSVHG
ncbi:MAG TPA: biotin carboxylase N-terminal domain-containing protein [Candidatus Limnocylindria bacterium]|nr:biotin carboxylase N-terminal domain-containing protein [Candidatus Limnocylindria bacterium]